MSSNKWKKFNLSEIIEIIGGGTPRTTVSEYWNGNIPWISVVDFGGEKKYIFETEKSITQLGLENSSTRILKKDQIIISARGTVGELAILGKDMAFNQSCYGLSSKAMTFNDFLYYLLKFNIEQIKRKTNGAVFDTITRETFDHIEINLPPLSDQRRIAEILSVLDDKIELNRQTNATLEAIAQAIFKEWFVNFNFPGATGELVESELGMIPKGWRVGELGEISTKITKGTTPTTFGDDFVEKGIRFLRVDCIRDESGIDETKTLFITSDTNNKLKRSQLEVNDILITIAGSIGRICIVAERILPANLNQAIGIIRINTKVIPVTYVYYFLKQQSIKEKLLSGVTQSVQANISLNDLSTLRIIIPPIMLLEKYDSIIRKNRDQTDNLTEQSTSLIGIRDQLLPKLMSGDLKI